MYGHLQVLSTIFCEEISISSLVGGEGGVRSHFTMYGWYRSGVLGALPGLGLLLLSVRGVLHMGGAPNNVSKWQMGFNSAFKGLMLRAFVYL